MRGWRVPNLSDRVSSSRSLDGRTDDVLGIASIPHSKGLTCDCAAVNSVASRLLSIPLVGIVRNSDGAWMGKSFRADNSKQRNAAECADDGFSMHLCVALSAQRYQILFLVATRLAAELEVVHLQVLHASADLAAPAVALQHLPMQLAVALRIEPKSGAFGADGLHEAFRLTSDRKASCCGLGRNL